MGHPVRDEVQRSDSPYAALLPAHYRLLVASATGAYTGVLLTSERATPDAGAYLLRSNVGSG